MLFRNSGKMETYARTYGMFGDLLSQILLLKMGVWLR